LVEQRFCKPWVRGSSPLSGLVRRLRFAIGVARRDPRLLVDYSRLWVGARRGVPVDPGWAAMDADQSLAELAYSLVRERRPATVIETGVARGITSASLLTALAENDFGELHSIDLPPPRMVDAGLVGAAIPEELKDRWHYHWGSARRLLPGVLAGSTGPRLFIHDSDHSYAHMRWEIETAWAALEPGDVLLCDDAHFHSGFADAAAAVGAEPQFLRQAQGLTGMLVRS
jgi:predicted O-methyltransferase YrrM